MNPVNDRLFVGLFYMLQGDDEWVDDKQLNESGDCPLARLVFSVPIPDFIDEVEFSIF